MQVLPSFAWATVLFVLMTVLFRLCLDPRQAGASAIRLEIMLRSMFCIELAVSVSTFKPSTETSAKPPSTTIFSPPLAAHGEDARPQRRDHGRMARERAEIALDTGHAGLPHVAGEQKLLRRDGVEMEGGLGWLQINSLTLRDAAFGGSPR
jgi:hypothetical protein